MSSCRSPQATSAHPTNTRSSSRLSIPSPTRAGMCQVPSGTASSLDQFLHFWQDGTSHGTATPMGVGDLGESQGLTPVLGYKSLGTPPASPPRGDRTLPRHCASHVPRWAPCIPGHAHTMLSSRHVQSLPQTRAQWGRGWAQPHAAVLPLLSPSRKRAHPHPDTFMSSLSLLPGQPLGRGGSQGIPSSPGAQDQHQLSVTHNITLVVLRPLLFSFLAVIHWQL